MARRRGDRFENGPSGENSIAAVPDRVLIRPSLPGMITSIISLSERGKRVETVQ
jgi:hypothetical protein